MKVSMATSASRIAMLSASICVAVTMGSPALAQDANDDQGIAEIIVTAQKRAESIQDTPLAVSALDTTALDQSGIKDAQGLTAIIPNVAVRPFNNSIIVATRGISNENTSNLGDASLAFHVNGVYVGRPRAAAALFYDVERVELLRGPQGTLYGRNSTAGALNIISKRPETDKISGGADLSYGNYDTVIARGHLNVPLSDTFAIRGSAYYAKQDGYATNNLSVPVLAGPPPVVGAINAANANIPSIKSGDDDGEFAARLSLLFKPSDKLRWVVIGGYQDTDEVGQVRSIANTPGFVAVAGPAAGQFFWPQQQDPRDARIYSLNTQPSNKVRSWDITSEIKYELSEAVEVTLLNGYRKEKSSLVVDAAGSANLSTIRTSGEAKQFSNELRLGSTGKGAFQWILGAYYFDEDQFDQLFINNVGGSPNNVVAANPYISSTSYAAFGQATYAISDSFKLIAGARYSRDEKKRFGFTVVGPGLTVAPNPLPPGSSYTNKQGWGRFNWKLGFDYDLNNDTMLYATVSTGYRAGGFNASSDVAYDPEDITAYEVGLKTDLLNRTLRMNFAGFYYDYKDLQVTSPRELNGRIQAFTQNAAEAKIWGVELEAIARPSRNLSVDLAVGYLNTKFGDFLSIDNVCTAAGLSVPPQFLPGCVTRQRFNPNGTPVLAPAGPFPGAPLVPVFDLQQVNYNGNRLANAPDVTVNLGVNWTMFDNDAGSLMLRGSVRLVGKSYLSEYNRRPDRVSSYSQSEARITYRTASKAFSLEAFVQNIENNDIPGSVSVTASGFGVSYLPPRTYGLRAGFSF
jgi:iron complex outermembrane recepter protein